MLKTNLFVLLFANPHLLEGVEGGQDGAANPDRIFTLRGGNDLHERVITFKEPLWSYYKSGFTCVFFQIVKAAI